MLGINLRRARREIPPKSIFHSSRSPSHAIRPALSSCHSPYYLHTTSHNLYATNPKKQCKLNRKFELKEQTEEYLFGLRMNFSFYFDRSFAGNEAGGECYRLRFEQLGNLRFERGKGITSITVGVLMVLRSYKYSKKLEALAKLSVEDEGFYNYALHLEARRSLLLLLKRGHEAGEGVTEEDVFDGVLAPRKAYMRMQIEESLRYFRRAKKGFVTLFEEDHAKSVDVTVALLYQTTMGDELRVLWKWVQVTCLDEAVTYKVANSLGEQLRKKASTRRRR